MINTDLLPDAPVCSKLVMGYKAFTATNTANTASMNRLTVAVTRVVAKFATILLFVLVHNFRFNCWVIILAEVCGGHVCPTVGAGFCPPVLP